MINVVNFQFTFVFQHHYHSTVTDSMTTIIEQSCTFNLGIRLVYILVYRRVQNIIAMEQSIKWLLCIMLAQCWIFVVV